MLRADAGSEKGDWLAVSRIGRAAVAGRKPSGLDVGAGGTCRNLDERRVGPRPSATHACGKVSGTPRWSPDGKWVAFDTYLQHGPQIFVIDAEGRNLHAITSSAGENCVPSWSHDGKFIYFASNRTGAWQVWKHSLENGAETQLTKQGGFDPLESYDGSTVYYSRIYDAGIWKVPSRAGDESKVVEGKPQIGYWGYFAVTKVGVYFLDAEAEPSPAIEFSDFATGRASTVYSFKERPARLQPSLSATADGKTIYFTQYDRQSVIKMMQFAH
jgi:WD40-like Beta Propeller Repeat